MTVQTARILPHDFLRNKSLQSEKSTLERCRETACPEIMRRFVQLMRCVGLVLLLSWKPMAEAAGGPGNAWRFPPEPNPIAFVVIPNAPSLNLYPFTVAFWMQTSQAVTF